MFDCVFGESIIKRAQSAGKIKITVFNLRDWSKDKHRKADDKPYGGGCGMVLCAQPIFDAVRQLKRRSLACRYIRPGQAKVKGSPFALQRRKMSVWASGDRQRSKVILLTPQGERLNQRIAKRLVKNRHMILICGHYEGIDERVRQYLVDDEIYIGDYVLTGGEIPAMALVDAIVRLAPGVLGHKDSSKQDSYSSGLLEYPQYTRPAVFKGHKVPQVLLSGDHKKI